MKFNSYSIKPRGQGEYNIFPPGAPFNEDNWGPLVVPKKGDVVPLTASTYEQWRVFIGREGHTALLDMQGRVLVDGTPAGSYTVERKLHFRHG
jgi:signal peptidase I